MRRHGLSAQVPVRQALERNEDAVAVWKAEVWPDIKGWRATWAPTSASDEAGQGEPPADLPRGARPVVRVRAAGGGRVSVAGVAYYPPGDRPHLFFKLLAYRRRKGEAKGFTWPTTGTCSSPPTGTWAPRWSGSGITSTSTWPRSWRASRRRTRPGCAFTGCPRTRRTLILRRCRCLSASCVGLRFHGYPAPCPLRCRSGRRRRSSGAGCGSRPAAGAERAGVRLRRGLR